MKRIYTAMVALVLVSLMLLPAFAYADGGRYGGHYRGGHPGWHGGPHPVWGLGLGFGAGLLSGYLLAPRVYAVPAPTCYQTIPGHWESRWDPYRLGYVNVYIPPQTTAYPCP